MDSATVLDDPDAIARAAESCLLFTRMRGLAAWAGAGQPVTPAGAPRPADLAAVCAAAGIALPPTSRRAIDIRDLQQAWTAARAADLLVVEGGRARAADDGGLADPATASSPVGTYWGAGPQCSTRCASTRRGRASRTAPAMPVSRC
ncbi:hypothetical protein [Frankia sp. Cr2]|uniref:hypothetical protein n=1 Tax=Frankia sp. Cr2 TaxID=3073932 RepID=UPI002AD3819D|nr:hypothetical protein [Frankia sp. Cr2]